MKCDQEDEKIVKYKDFTIEIERMWNVQNGNDTSNNRGNCNHLKITQTIPEQRTGNLDVKELEKTAVLCTALRKVLMYKHKIFIVGNNITCTTYPNNRMTATLSTLEMRSVSSM